MSVGECGGVWVSGGECEGVCVRVCDCAWVAEIVTFRAIRKVATIGRN